MALSRYRELYNKLTRSKAYGETGVPDGSKINKQNWTPHNLRRICLDANGVLLVYHTTNNTTQRLIEYRTFKSIQKQEENIVQLQQGKEPFKSVKPMIDALYSNIVFSNIEEIIFFTGNFNPQLVEDYNNELMGIDKFGRDINLIKKSFKRLKGIALVERPLIVEGFENYTAEKDIVTFLNENNIPFKAVKFEPEKDENGLLKNVELDSNDYALDKKYDPNQPNNGVDYRLSKYFYDLEQSSKRKGEIPKLEEPNKQEVDKLRYARQLKKQGFNIIDDVTVVAGNTKIFSKTLNWLKYFCTEKEGATMGYRYAANLQNQDVLEEKGVKDIKSADIWSSKIFTLDEDLQFRLFVREDDISYTIIIKLPLGLRDFGFNQNDASLNNIAHLFSNLSSSKGEIFQSSIMQTPRLCNLKATRRVECAYSAIEVVLAKDLMKFKQSNWKLIDYIQACQGKTNEISQFPQLVLGSRIAIGVKPGAIKSEIFDCSGKYVVSGMIGGQAGSGKTAMFDSLLLQFLALTGDFGDGAVIMLDAKQEWIPAWRNVFSAYDIPLYGFDGSLLRNQERLFQQVSSKVSIFKLN